MTMQERLRKYAEDWRDRAASNDVVLEAAAHIDALEARAAPNDALDWFAKNICLELSWGQIDPEDEGGDCAWLVHQRRGNINDTEWHLLGTGDTPAEAIAAARLSALEPS